MLREEKDSVHIIIGGSFFFFFFMLEILLYLYILKNYIYI